MFASAGVAPRNNRDGPFALCSTWQLVQAFSATVVYGPTFAAGRVAVEIVAWIEVGHGTSGFGALPTVRGVVPWQARHIDPTELSRTRKFSETLSRSWTCGLWQLSHSTLPLIR